MRKIVIVGGAARSGTSLIRNLLAGHPDLFVVRTEWVGFYKSRELAKATGVRKVVTRSDLERVLEQGLNSTELRLWNVTPEAAKRVSEGQPPEWDGVFLTLAEARHETDPDLRLVVKAPWSEQHFPRLKPALETRGWEVRFLYAVRSPVDTYLSYRHRRFAWKNFSSSAHTDTLAWCARWLESTGRWLELQQLYPNTVRLARFEALLDDAVLECQSWCRWLGIRDASADMVQLRETKANSSFDNQEVGTRAGGVLDLGARSKQTCSAGELDLLRRCCGDRARVFEYDLGEAEAVDASRYVSQHLSLAQLDAHDYPRFMTRDLVRRLKRFALTIYSRLTRRETSLLLR